MSEVPDPMFDPSALIDRAERLWCLNMATDYNSAGGTADYSHPGPINGSDDPHTPGALVLKVSQLVEQGDVSGAKELVAQLEYAASTSPEICHLPLHLDDRFNL